MYFHDNWDKVIIGTCNPDPGTITDCGGYIFSQKLWCVEVDLPEYDFYGLC